MQIGVLGINHKSSELALREAVAKAADQCFGKKSLWGSWLNGVLLSTCNRTEIYFSGEALPEVHSQILSVLREAILPPFEHGLYSYFGVECFSHLAIVTSGLDSAVTFETEIQGQVKAAYEASCLEKKLPSALHFLFQKCLKIGKEVRSLFPISQQGFSFEQMIYQLVKNFFYDLNSINILFVGNSEINRKILSLFHKKAEGKMTLCTSHQADLFQEEYPHIQICKREDLHCPLEYELIICGTYMQNYFISRADLEEKKEVRARLILDLAVPRNVDPLVQSHPYVQLLNIDDLARCMDQKKAFYEQEIERSLFKIREKAKNQIDLFAQKSSRLCEVVL